MDGDFDFGCTHRHKRSYTQMEHEGSSSPPWPTIHRLSVSRKPSNGGPSRPQVSGLHLPGIDNMPPSQQRRYEGDGLDFRRPASLSRSDSHTNIIDLTADDAGPMNSRRAMQRAQRPPRFAREIIDVIDVDEEDSRRPAAPPDSPEIEFISARTLPPRRQDPPIRRAEEDDVEITGSNRLPPGPAGWRGLDAVMAMADVFGEGAQHPRGQFAHLRERIHRAANNMRPPVPPPRGGGAAGRGHGHIHVGFMGPGDMDFQMVGFDLGIPGRPAPPPPPPTYDAPEAAPEGFTRSPGEEDPLICPNCEDELCVGESDLKRQVWIVKTCGHVYCGECTANRSAKRSAKGKEKIAPAKHKPFKECVVDGCNKKTSGAKTMFQVFL